MSKISLFHNSVLSLLFFFLRHECIIYVHIIHADNSSRRNMPVALIYLSFSYFWKRYGYRKHCTFVWTFHQEKPQYKHWDKEQLTLSLSLWETIVMGAPEWLKDITRALRPNGWEHSQRLRSITLIQHSYLSFLQKMICLNVLIHAETYYLESYDLK